MSTPFTRCSETVGRLHAAVNVLEQATDLLRLPPLAGREWYELLRQKLLPQLRDDTFLVAAVVGGTNIGKSVIFNHLAGCRASATSPRRRIVIDGRTTAGAPTRSVGPRGHCMTPETERRRNCDRCAVAHVDPPPAPP